MKTIMTLAATAALFCATASFADDYTVGDITVEHPRTFENANAVKVGGGFMHIVNKGETDDALIAVRSDSLPRIELHKSEIDDQGVARMIEQENIPVPAGETVTLQPGGLHVMFMGMGGTELSVGDAIEATLVFENAGPLEVRFVVEKRGDADHKPMKHGTMGSSD